MITVLQSRIIFIRFRLLEMVININGKSKKAVTVCNIFINPPVFDIMFGAGAVGYRAVSRSTPVPAPLK
jgi:hypothetical protein